MKKLLLIALLMMFAAAAFAQATPTPQAPAPGQAQAPAQAPGGKPTPQAKSPEEFKAYKDALAKPDPAAVEAAANDFAAKYPESELRAPIYQQAMVMYDGQSNAPKALELARKVLKLEPENVVALVLSAANLAEHTHDADLDKDERLNEASTNANKALGLIDKMPVPSDMTPEKADGTRNTLRAWSWNAIGICQYIRKDYAAAEASFLKSVDFGKAEPEALTFMRLTLAQDHLGKYGPALQSVQSVLQLAQPDSQLAQYATQEKDRLTKLAPAPPK